MFYSAVFKWGGVGAFGGGRVGNYESINYELRITRKAVRNQFVFF